jgi:hypothetical protein
MSNALSSTLTLVDPTHPAVPYLRAVPYPAAPTAPTSAGIYRLPDVTPDPSMVGYLVLVPVGTQLDVTAVPAAGYEAESEPEHGPQPERGPQPELVPQPGSGPEAGSAPSARGIALDPLLRVARVDGELLELTYLEFELLAHLTAHPHRVHTRDHLVSAVWGYGHVGDGRTVDVHVARLRRKLGVRHRDSIVTIRRVGYKFVPSSGR